MGRMRVRVHGMRTAYTPNADRYLACGLCVVACPEKAIQLVEINPQAAKGSAQFFDSWR
jgi:Fe-S-cluster-containing hydrogenase component 2